MTNFDDLRPASYDIVVLGAGIAGITAALEAGRKGFSTALIGNNIGGHYLSNGCMDARYLYESANCIRDCASARKKGVIVKGLALNLNRIMRSKNEYLTYAQYKLEKELDEAEVTVIEGFGRPYSNGFIDVTTEKDEHFRVNYKKLIIATGARSVKKSIESKFETTIDTKEIMNLTYVPEDLGIFGEGIEVCELASIFSTFGSKVKIITSNSEILNDLDAQIIGRLEEQMKKKGIHIYKKAVPVDIYKDSLGGVHVELKSDNGKRATIMCSDIYIAPNKKACTKGLQTLRIDMDGNFIDVNTSFETSVKNVYAIGQATRYGIDTAHSMAQAKSLIQSFSSEDHEVDYDSYQIPICIHTFPEIASIGLTTQTASEYYDDVRIGLAPIGAGNGSLFSKDKQGFIKVIVDGEYLELLGCHIIGENASEIIGQAQTLMASEGTIYDLEKIIHPYPSLSQALEVAVNKIKKN